MKTVEQLKAFHEEWEARHREWQALLESNGADIERYRHLRWAAKQLGDAARSAREGREADEAGAEAREIWHRLYQKGIAMDGDIPLRPSS